MKVKVAQQAVAISCQACKMKLEVTDKVCLNCGTSRPNGGQRLSVMLDTKQTVGLTLSAPVTDPGRRLSLENVDKGLSQEKTERSRFSILFPDAPTPSVVIWAPEKILKKVIEHACTKRALDPASFSITDKNKNVLDANATLQEIGVREVFLIPIGTPAPEKSVARPLILSGSAEEVIKPVEAPVAKPEPSRSEIFGTYLSGLPPTMDIATLKRIEALYPFFSILFEQAQKPEAPLFGKDIQQLMDNQKLTKLKFLNVPWFFRMLSDQILVKGLLTEGVGRVPGSSHVIVDTTQVLDSGKYIDVTAEQFGPEELFDLWKAYLRALPAPLLSPAAPWQQILHSAEEPAEKYVGLQKLVSELPSAQQACLQEICFVTHFISLVSDVNKMSVQNLGVVLGMSNFLIDLSQNERGDLFELLIEGYHSVFRDLPSKELEPSEPAKVMLVVGEGQVTSLFLKEGVSRLCDLRPQLETKFAAIDKSFQLYQVLDRDVLKILEETDLRQTKGSLYIFTEKQLKPE